MLKLIMKIVLTPFMLVARLMLGLAAFITSIASTIIGLTVTVFLLLGVVEFTIGYWQNGIAFTTSFNLNAFGKDTTIDHFLLHLSTSSFG